MLLPVHLSVSTCMFVVLSVQVRISMSRCVLLPVQCTRVSFSCRYVLFPVHVCLSLCMCMILLVHVRVFTYTCVVLYVHECISSCRCGNMPVHMCLSSCRSMILPVHFCVSTYICVILSVHESVSSACSWFCLYTCKFVRVGLCLYTSVFFVWVWAFACMWGSFFLKVHDFACTGTCFYVFFL